MEILGKIKHINYFKTPRFLKSRKAILTAFLSLPFLATSFAQTTEDKIKDFKETRKKEFVNLIGGIQEGIGINYNTDKTVIEGSGGFGIDRWNSLIQLKGSVGTTTNLSTLFTQKNLPTFSAAVTYHFLLTGGISVYFSKSIHPVSFQTVQPDEGFFFLGPFHEKRISLPSSRSGSSHQVPFAPQKARITSISTSRCSNRYR